MDVPQLQSPPVAMPNLPDEFPAPPLGYELLFVHWAGVWHRHYGVQPISTGLRDALQRLVAKTLVPSRVALDIAESALTSAHKQLMTAQMLVATSQHELFLATSLATRVDRSIGNTNAVYNQPRVESAMANAQWASDSFSQVQAAYNQAKSVYATEQTAYNAKAAAYYAQRDLIYCTSSIEILARQADLPKAGLELVLKPISLVAIPESAAPSPHEANHDVVRLQVDCDQGSPVVARCFQRDVLGRHPKLRELWVEIGQEYIVQYGIGSRNMPTSKAAVDYFIAEIEPRVKAILQVSKPHAQFRVISDFESDRAHLFLMVDVANQAGQRVCCSVAVMFTMPYLFIAERDNVSTSNAFPDWVFGSEFPSEEYGRKILTQVYDYLKDGSTVSPRQVCGTVAQHVAIWSTYNDTWIVHNMGACDSAATPPPDMHAAGADNMLTISVRFSSTNTDPHIAFVYAQVLDDLIRDMQNSTEDDSSVSEVQGNTDFIATMPAAAAALPDHNPD